MATDAMDKFSELLSALGALHAKEGSRRSETMRSLGNNYSLRDDNNPINNARRATARPVLDADDAELGLTNIVRYSPEYLRTLVAITLRRPSIMKLWAAGSFHFTYWFFWTCEVTAGWRATPKQLAAAELKESTHALCDSSNPLLTAGNGRGLRHSDFYFSDSPARIVRVAVGLRVHELAEVEREGCRLTRHRTLGFAGNRKDGGTNAVPKNGNIHGVSVLVIDDLGALGLVVSPSFAPAYAARALQGSETATQCGNQPYKVTSSQIIQILPLDVIKAFWATLFKALGAWVVAIKDIGPWGVLGLKIVRPARSAGENLSRRIAPAKICIQTWSV